MKRIHILDPPPFFFKKGTYCFAHVGRSIGLKTKRGPLNTFWPLRVKVDKLRTALDNRFSGHIVKGQG